MNYLLYDFMACSVKPLESDFAAKKTILFYSFSTNFMSDSGGNNRPKIANLVQQIRNNNSANMSVLFYNFVTVLVSEFERNIYASMMSVGWIFIHFELNFWCFLLVLMTEHILLVSCISRLRLEIVNLF